MNSVNLVDNIPDKFYEINDYDHYNRTLVKVFLRQIDDSWIRGRLANIKAGNIFKVVDMNGNSSTDATIYRAINGAKYDVKEDRIVVEATTLEDYENEVGLDTYTYESLQGDPCRE